MKYVIASHVLYKENGDENYGQTHDLYYYLRQRNKEVIFIKHSLEGEFASTINDQKAKKTKLNNYLIRIPQEIIFNLKEVNKYQNNNKVPITYVGVDPINSISGFILKILKKIDRNIYFTVDYADIRFNNILLNKIYHFTDKLALIGSDEVWCVSSRIVEKRKKQGIPSKKIKFLPNSPKINDVPYIKYVDKKDLIIVSNLTKSLNLIPILDVLFALKEEFPDIRLKIIGSGPEEDYFKEIVREKGLYKYVKFLGQKTHDQVLKNIARSFIGFALYTNENSWNYYGDSMKAREYVAAGIPVIINDVPSTADDIQTYKAGLVLKNIDVQRISKFISKCVRDNAYYNEMRNNARKLGKKYDKEKLLVDALHFN